MAKSLRECRVTVVGMGLMGASLCMDLTHGGLCREVRGVARRTDTVLQAFFSGAVDLATNDLHTGVMGADIVVLATPVRTILATLEEIGPWLWPGTLVTDMGSTKGEIVAALQNMPAGIEPVGSHPMCGKETAGFEAAEAGLYVGAPWVICAPPRTSRWAVDLTTELARAVGARPLEMEAARHDRLVASISHLPYLVAGALVDAVAEEARGDGQLWDLAAGGFRDTTRVAASDTRMFLDILVTNREAVLARMEQFERHMGELRTLLEQGDEERLCAKLGESQRARSQWKRAHE
jgi:prephenate dehydrogenase